MHKRSSILDFNQVEKSVDQTIGEAPPSARSGKNKAAQELGRLGGLKGGKARAAKLTAERRSDIASKAANARWGKEN